MRRNRELKCSFCRRDKDEVQKLIAGEGVFICDVCILEFVKILGEEHLPFFEDMLEIARIVQEN